MSGGWDNLKLVEAYDHHENKWTYKPDMIYARQRHGSVSMGNKMFVIGGHYNTSCEVFDSISRKFTAIKNIEVTNIWRLSVVSIANKIFAFPKLFRSGIKAFHIYDVLNDQWYVEKIHLSEIKSVISCSKLPVGF